MENQLEERIAALEKQVFMCKNILTFDEASKFLNLSKSYLYKLTSAGRIPFYRPQGKLVYFERTELEIWLRQNPVKTREQIEFEAQRYIQMNKLLKK
ncbi:excisionase family DNA-binding protein [Bacteroides sp. CG01]|uniref:excisionase family DNA-binding protein n=1 Tax=Bacteroides sp. CG01 TaxID=3096000 RepID=UPI002AFE3929|nr:excisionase family DNA-binding protein [Bacteroides sp. CG01]